MENIVEKLINKLDKEGFISDDRIIYKYGLMLMINEGITFSLVLLLSILIHRVLFGVLYIICFSYLREYIGGYHASTYGKCRCTYLFLYFMNILVLNFHYKYLYFIFFLICIPILLWIAPVDVPAKILSFSEKEFYKKIALKRICIYFLLIISFTFFNIELSELLCTVFITVTILTIIQLFINKSKGGEKNE